MKTFFPAKHLEKDSNHLYETCIKMHKMHMQMQTCIQTEILSQTQDELLSESLTAVL
jgi:hypothetical protein